MLDFAFGIPVPGFSDDYKPVDRDISFPEILKPNINKRGYLPENILGPIHFAEVGETGVLSYHTQENQAFSQHLVFVRDNRIIKEQILAEGIQKLNPEAFFMSGRFVYAVNGDNRKIAVFLI